MFSKFVLDRVEELLDGGEGLLGGVGGGLVEDAVGAVEGARLVGDEELLAERAEMRALQRG
jgi:hypothetical protein